MFFHPQIKDGRLGRDLRDNLGGNRSLSTSNCAFLMPDLIWGKPNGPSKWNEPISRLLRARLYLPEFLYFDQSHLLA